MWMMTTRLRVDGGDHYRPVLGAVQLHLEAGGVENIARVMRHGALLPRDARDADEPPGQL